MTPRKPKEKTAYQDQWEKSPGFVYFMAAGKPSKAVKIGVTTQKTLLQRLRAVQNGNHEIVHVIGLIACDGMERPMIAAETKEKELHKGTSINPDFLVLALP